MRRSSVTPKAFAALWHRRRLPLNGAVTPANWVLRTTYGDDEDELRRLFTRFQRLARLYLRYFPRKEPARAPYSEKPPPTACGDRNHPRIG